VPSNSALNPQIYLVMTLTCAMPAPGQPAAESNVMRTFNIHTDVERFRT
jgi:hypothetical protein